MFERALAISEKATLVRIAEERRLNGRTEGQGRRLVSEGIAVGGQPGARGPILTIQSARYLQMPEVVTRMIETRNPAENRLY